MEKLLGIGFNKWSTRIVAFINTVIWMSCTLIMCDAVSTTNYYLTRFGNWFTNDGRYYLTTDCVYILVECIAIMSISAIITGVLIQND